MREESRAAGDTFKPEESLGYMIHYVGRLYARALTAELARLGVQIGSFPVLLALWETDGQTQSELAVRVQIEQPTMAATLVRMERDGLVRREPDPRDRRAQRVLLTDRARALRDPAIAAARAVNARSTSRLKSIRPSDFLDVLHEVAAGFETGVPLPGTD